MNPNHHQQFRPTTLPPIGGGNPMPPVYSLPPMNTSSNYRPLNVKDALSYLDQVKIQFANEPEVYNRFLDIMKDFKSQAIDTPGVIERVSQLFRGHSQLIIGFNTFLPPGYKIEISPDKKSYTITTPTATITSGIADAGPSYYPQHPAVPPPIVPPVVPAEPPNSIPSVEPIPPVLNPPNNAVNSQQAKKPIEFNHAISYVNKIKQRFVNDPETYKQFLEILRTYQNEQKPIAEVYAQVQALFRQQPDLLDEFKQFLPDYSTPASSVGNNVSHQPQPSVTNNWGGNRRTSNNQLATGSRKPPPHISNQTTVPQPASHIQHAPSQSFDKKKVLQVRQHQNNRYLPNGRWNVTEEFEFFEKVKKCLSNKQSYTEFLKVLNLFNQDIIDANVLVQRVEPFIGKSAELFEWFKKYVSFSPDHVENPVNSDKQQSINHNNLLKSIAGSKRSGNSYRLLPQEYIQPKSTGRDDIANEVLNDSWVCHPTWASEDGGFIAHKKNQYEDALYRCEEERYEFDLNIEACKQTISRLQIIFKQIEDMESIEDRRQLKLPDGLGDGGSKCIYKLVIKKIYDEERGREVIECLHEHPYITIPVVLKRLKQKDEEWRRSQREWNKVWREIDGKNFYKSLDHQGINFKNVDKKNTSSKSLIQEIEAIYRTQQKPQFLFILDKDSKEFKAAIRLMLSFLDKNSQFRQEEIDQVEQFTEKFLMNELMKDSTILFGNNSFYLLFRLLNILYQRLKTASEIISAFSTSEVNQVAKSLDLVNTFKNSDTSITLGRCTWNELLSFIEKLFQGDIDQNTFEEQIRFWFGKSGYNLFTIDKVVHAVTKQLLSITNDSRNQKLYQLFVKNLNNATGSLLAYKVKADELVDEYENLYKFEFNRHALSIELLGDTGNGAVDANLKEVGWSDYIDKYVKSTCEAGNNCFDEDSQIVFMKRNFKQVTKKSKNDQFDVENGLECKICINTFRMFFVKDSEDYFRRKRSMEKKEYQKKHLAFQVDEEERNVESFFIGEGSSFKTEKIDGKYLTNLFK